MKKNYTRAVLSYHTVVALYCRVLHVITEATSTVYHGKFEMLRATRAHTERERDETSDGGAGLAGCCVSTLLLPLETERACVAVHPVCSRVGGPGPGPETEHL